MISGCISRAGRAVRENRRFIRVAPRGLVSRTATIIVDPGKPVITCNVIDLSAGGACLEVIGQAVILEWVTTFLFRLFRGRSE